MTPKETYEVLREFNLWRRGEGKYEGFYQKFPYTPKEIGIALDVAIEKLKKEVEK